MHRRIKKVSKTNRNRNKKKSQSGKTRQEAGKEYWNVNPEIQELHQ
jgi:hypothetical protein